MARPDDVKKPQAASVQCPDTAIATHRTATEDYREASLSNARKMVLEDIGRVVIVPNSYLWDIYPVTHDFEGIRRHLTKEGWLTNEHKWNPGRISKEYLRQWRKGSTEQEAFKPLADIFNAILSYEPSESNSIVLGMVNAGLHSLKSDRISTNRPDAYLVLRPPQMKPSTEGAKISKQRLWRDVVCPFEYKFGDGDKDDNDEKLIWNLHHLLRCDPRRSFSFGGTVEGTLFTVWLCCRAALFKLQRFDWIEEPELLIRFYIILAFSPESGLGIDAGIERLNHDFELRFKIDDTEYQVSEVLFDVGADATCSSGTRVFRVIDKANSNEIYRVVKDCWVEQREGGRPPEHEIVQAVRRALGDEHFNDHFVNTLGHCFIRNLALENICKTLSRIRSDGWVTYSVEPLNPQYHGRSDSMKVYALQSTVTVANQIPFLTPKPRQGRSHQIHPRSRYQVVYEQVGTSLYQVTSPHQIFRSLENIIKGLRHLHSDGFVHRDIHPGNVIIVDGVAKISDMEFVKERSVTALGEATMCTTGSPLRALTEVRTGSIHFTAVEVVSGQYLFLPEDSTLQETMDWLLAQEVNDPQTTEGNSERRPERLFLHNPLHDYESVWWMATWALFRCQPKPLDSEEAEDLQTRAMEDMFSKHRTTVMIASGSFRGYKKSLPEVLHPLFDTLEAFRGVLTMGYQDYEKSFDGSSILPNVEHFCRCLTALANRADKVELYDFPTLSALQPPPLDRSLIIPEESERSFTGGRGIGTPSQEETTEEPQAVAGDTKGAARTREPEDDIFLSAPAGKGNSSFRKFEPLPLPNKRKASISSISEQPSRKTRVFDNESSA